MSTKKKTKKKASKKKASKKKATKKKATKKKATKKKATKKKATKKEATKRVAWPSDGAIAQILSLLDEHYADARTALEHQTAFELLVATILSAQCTDERVNQVTPVLFERYPDAAAMAAADRSDVEAIIHSTGFYRNKAKNIIAASKALVADHAGAVPPRMDALVALPGVARKTANVVLGSFFGLATGVVVDTHVARLSQRLGLTGEQNPIKIEKDLMAAIPKDHWISFSHHLITHGRQTCVARKPRCSACFLADLCPSRVAAP